MRKNAKLMLTIAGAGIIGLLTGCASEEIPPAPATIQQIVPETGNTENISPATRPAPNSDTSSESLNMAGSQISDGNTVTGQSTDNSSTGASGNTSQPSSGSGTVELIALADTEDQAGEIADLYQIDLKSFSLGVAVYTTDKDPYELIYMGREKGYPALSINHQLQLY